MSLLWWRLFGFYSIFFLPGECQHSCIIENDCQHMYLNNVCYYLFTNEINTWDENKKICESQGQTMVFASEETVASLLSTITLDWRGVWLDGKAENLETWTFLNETPIYQFGLLQEKLPSKCLYILYINTQICIKAVLIRLMSI